MGYPRAKERVSCAVEVSEATVCRATKRLGLYAYSPRGKRAFFKMPRNRGKNTTLLASIGCKGLDPSMAVEGSTIKEVFEAYVECFLAPR